MRFAMKMRLIAFGFGWSALVAFHAIVAKASDDTGGLRTTPRVTVALLLLDSPSSMQATNDLAALGHPISDPGQLSVGGKAYLETWCQTPGPNGITTAVVDVTYDAAWFDTSLAQVSLASQWSLLAFGVSVDDQVGRVDDFGGNNLSGLGVAPSWAKIGTVEFDVVTATTGRVSFCSEFAGGGLTFAIRAEGVVQPVDVHYGCLALGCNQDAHCDDDTPCTCDKCATGMCRHAPVPYGNVDCVAGIVDVDDIFCVLDGFANPDDCPFADLFPCEGNGLVDLDDIFAVLDAFAGEAACPNPCS